MTKYNVGDIVVIKSLRWYNKNKNYDGEVDVKYCFVKEMSKYCGRSATISWKDNDSYGFSNIHGFTWTDEMLDDTKIARREKLRKIENEIQKR